MTDLVHVYLVQRVNMGGDLTIIGVFLSEDSAKSETERQEAEHLDWHSRFGRGDPDDFFYETFEVKP